MSIQSRVEAAIQRLLYPLVKLLMEYGVSEPDFQRLVRTMYVKVAAENIENSPIEVGAKATATRIALMTGIGRNSIKSILDDETSVIGQDEWYRHRCAAVLEDWHSTPGYIDERGAPISIPFSSNSGPSFEALVHARAKALSAHAVLEELKIVGAVEEVPENDSDPDNENTLLVAKSKNFRRYGSKIEDLEEAFDHLYNHALARYEIMINGSEQLEELEKLFVEVDPGTSHVLRKNLRKQAESLMSSAARASDRHRISDDSDQEPHRVGIGVYIVPEDAMARSRFFSNVLIEVEEEKLANE